MTDHQVFVLLALHETSFSFPNFLHDHLPMFCFIKLISAPVKLIFKFIINMVSGFVILLITELVLGFFDISLGFSIFNCLVAGVFGIPGVIVLVLIKLLL